MAYTPDTKLRSLRQNGQVVQPNVEQVPDNNGWPDPLTDPSTPYRVAVTNGKNGEQSNMDETNTSQAKNGGWQLGEGSADGAETQPTDLENQRAEGENVSQKIWSDPAGASPKAPGDQSLSDDAMGDGMKDPFKTTQQLRGEHHKAEGN